MLKNQNGFTLIEVLVSLLVLAIGLLGMAGLQLLSMQSSSGALNRSQATMLAYDLAERMRRNDIEALNDGYVGIALNNAGAQQAAPADPACINAGCTSAQLANQDIREWLDNFTDIAGIGLDGNNWQPMLPDATASLRRGGNNADGSVAADNEFILFIQWAESDTGQQNIINKSWYSAKK